MVGQKGIAFQKQVLNCILGNTGIASQANLYFALFTLSPAPSSDNGTEVSGGSYVRTTIVNNTTNFPFATQSGSSPSQIKNAIDIIFVQATANWGTIVAGGIYSAITAGTLFYWFPISPNIVINTGFVFKMPANSLLITEA